MTTGLSNGNRTRSVSPTSQALPIGLQSNAIPSFTGKTLVNILGNDGNCESLTPFTSVGTAATLSTTQVKSGTYSVKLAPVSNQSNIYKDYAYPLDSTKYYFVGLWAYLESYTGAFPQMNIRDYGGANATPRYSASVNNTLLNQWQFLYAKIPTNNAVTTTNGFRLFIGSGGIGDYVCYFDSVRIYEVDSTTYNAIGSTITATTSPSIDDVLPYVDNVKHVVNPYVLKTGKNIFSVGSASNINGVLTNVTVQSGLIITGNIGTSPLILSGYWTYNTSDTSTSPRIGLQIYYTDGTSTQVTNSTVTKDGVERYLTLSVTPTAGKQVAYARVFLFDYSTQNNINRSCRNVQLEYGSVATGYIPYNTQTFSATTTLASNVSGTVADSLAFLNGIWTKTKQFVTDFLLDGSLTWVLHTSNTGNKVVKVSITGTNNTEVVVKFDGKILKRNTGGTATYSPDDCILSSNMYYVAIGQTDTGFGDSYTPTQVEINAYFYGWKLNNGTFGTPFNGTGTKTWTTWNATSNTGSVTTVPTTLASGFTPYKLSYQLATPTTETVTTSGSVSLDGNAINTIEVGASQATATTGKYAVTCNPTNVTLKYNINSGIDGYGKYGQVNRVGTNFIPPKI